MLVCSMSVKVDLYEMVEKVIAELRVIVVRCVVGRLMDVT